MAQTIDDAKYLWQKKLDNGHVRIGFNDIARQEIGEISFATFPDGLAEVKLGDVVLSIEGAKAVSEVHTPLAGKVAKVNLALKDHPEYLESPDEEKNWIIELF
ncbi:glycine cleavage system protein H [Lentilactobacillus farraginis]|uniref:Glycine cleavage H-protein n=1 Tax=Lentilactobacillus farraginis DSM 18382 = JCM 14108 TaxID=1423743 RepID=X0PC75_9LACO|nr:glycine cleavage system protein H [Lentilactobacillus farraginis]KRM03625.1 glycine cleavage H-protein [Lentilactobacillus farraginis DSM 18382 = JCM 14108]GAF37863.1 glycine cleavage system H protein [Lentilactobacillus farraginis DSM 18382 = JCM 14108]